MSEVKEQWIAALEKSADQLEAIVGNHEIPGLEDPEGMRRWMRESESPNWVAKWKLVFFVEVFRSRAAALRRGNWTRGDWPPFRPQEAQQHMEGLEQIRARLEFTSLNAAFKECIREALPPQRDVLEPYAVKSVDSWLCREEDCDPMPKWDPPPPAGT